MGLDHEIARIERAVRSGEQSGELYLRLGQLLLRAGRPIDAQNVLSEALSVLPPVVSDMSGQHTDLDPTRAEILEVLESVQSSNEARIVAARRQALTAKLEAGDLDAAEHDELIRLEVAAGAPIHKRQPACPACAGPVAPHPEQDGAIVCARSGEGGDLCRHTDAKNLFPCDGCGLVLRAWNEGRLKPDPHEPPAMLLDRARCELCGNGVADWRRHYKACGKAAKVSDFPRCDVCNGRGHHARALRCARCKGVVMRIPCLERRSRRS